MYKRHSIIISIIGLTTLAVSLIFNLPFKQFAEPALTVNSISIAVYIAAASALLGSKYSYELKKKIDPEINDKTKLGVLASYLNKAGTVSLISIIISCLYCVGFNVEGLEILKKICNSIAYVCFSLSILFLFLILKLLIASMVNAANNAHT